MATLESVPSLMGSAIQCVEMHTTGEPTRIVVSGYPNLKGSLLEQRSQAKEKYDHLRRRIMLEPRGHFNMYGAVLRPDTELTLKEEADMGVLFIHNEGYSTMCGHATIALGRFLVDTHDLNIFPRRNRIQHDFQTQTARMKLHVPCGLIEVTVPTTVDGKRSDPQRPVSFVSVPSFATAVNVNVEIPADYCWPEKRHGGQVNISIAYGGAFYCLVSPQELGFPKDILRQKFKLQELDRATRMLKAAIIADQRYRHYLEHPSEHDLSFLYGVVVVDSHLGAAADGCKGAETGLCFFADQEIDRSPTGSAVAARVALAVAQGDLVESESWTYHSLVSNAWAGNSGFVGTPLSSTFVTVGKRTLQQTQVQVRGFAYYTGFQTFVVEQGDALGDEGFILEQLEVRNDPT